MSDVQHVGYREGGSTKVKSHGLGRPLTFRGAVRRIQRHQRLLARIRKLLAEPMEPVPPCLRCGSPEGCYSDCPVAPWDMDD
jgi:hypothetical protein